MIQRLISLSVLLTIAFSFRVYANGDPVVRYSSINRVANPEPLSISEIRIVSEQVNITHEDGYNCFDITYLFKNDSYKNFPEINYGFPIDYLVANEQETYMIEHDYYTESVYETGWSDNLIKDVSFTFNDSILQFHSAKESVREAGYEVEIYEDGNYGDSIPIDAINRRWFYTKFSMAPKSEATFIVRYKVYANSKNSFYGDCFSFSRLLAKNNENKPQLPTHPMLYRHLASEFTILYDFTPAKHFGNGEPFSLNVNIDLSNLENPYLKLEGMDCYTSHLMRSHWTAAKDLSPIDLRVFYTSPRNQESIEHTVAPFVISSDKYDVSQSQRTTDIDFHEPTFISELVCYLDTALVKSINSSISFSDGHTKEYQYSINPPQKWDNKINYPIILTITDLIHDGILKDNDTNNYEDMTGKFGDSYFKIKKIIVDFDIDSLATQTSNPVYNILLLDSRFDK